MSVGGGPLGYSKQLLAFFHSRVHAGRLEGAIHYGEAGTPGAGPYLRSWLRVSDDLVQAARWDNIKGVGRLRCLSRRSSFIEGRGDRMGVNIINTA